MLRVVNMTHLMDKNEYATTYINHGMAIFNLNITDVQSYPIRDWLDFGTTWEETGSTI